MTRKPISILAVCGLALLTGCSDRTSSDSATDSSSSTTPQTTTPSIPIQTTTTSIPIVEKDKILGTICTTAPRNPKAFGSSGQPTELYMCERNGSHITMQIDGPEELANFEKRFVTDPPIESQLLCGNGWKLNFTKADYSPGSADLLYRELNKVGIPSQSCA
jgi:hypothetical protein